MKVIILFVGLLVTFVLAAPAPAPAPTYGASPTDVSTRVGKPSHKSSGKKSPTKTVSSTTSVMDYASQIQTILPGSLPGGFPFSPKIAATIHIPGPYSQWPRFNITVCDGVNFTGTCTEIIGPEGMCIKAPYGPVADGTISSTQFNANNLFCTFYDPPDCQSAEQFIELQVPGISDLSVTAGDNTISSFVCVGPEYGP